MKARRGEAKAACPFQMEIHRHLEIAVAQRTRQSIAPVPPGVENVCVRELRARAFVCVCVFLCVCLHVCVGVCARASVSVLLFMYAQT
jgi:hypothetical protein